MLNLYAINYMSQYPRASLIGHSTPGRVSSVTVPPGESHRSLHRYVLQVEAEQEKENKIARSQGRKPKKLDKFIHIYKHHGHEFSIDWTMKGKPHQYLSNRRTRDIPFLRRDGVIE